MQENTYTIAALLREQSLYIPRVDSIVPDNVLTILVGLQFHLPREWTPITYKDVTIWIRLGHGLNGKPRWLARIRKNAATTLTYGDKSIITAWEKAYHGKP